MSITVVITLSTEIGGDDYSTGEPDVMRVELDNSPAQIWQYEVQGPSGGATMADNYFLVSDQLPASCLWVDPQQVTGATFILRGATGDVGIALDSSSPSLVPVSTLTPFSGGGGFTVANGYAGGITAYQQNQIVLTSSQNVQLQAAWW